jgi:transcriptional regulator
MSFEPRTQADLLKLVGEYPLAWVVSADSSGFCATPLPMLAEPGPDGGAASLLGHFALSNPHVAMLRAVPQATILFMGPQGYISPELISKPGWAPTWNYAMAQFDVQIEFLPQENSQALEKLVYWMERERQAPWTVARMGPRYEQMAQKIVAFRARVQRVRGRFKLGQDETQQTRTEILQKLDNPDMVRWMADFNPEPVEKDIQRVGAERLKGT